MTDQDPTQGYEAVQATPVSAPPVTRPGRSRARWFAAIAAVVLVVGAAAGATLMLTASAGDPGVLAWAPADSVVYAEARLDLPGDQKAQLAKVMAAFPGFDDQAAFPTKLNEALDVLVGKASDGKMSYRADIDPWFGGQVSVSIGPIPASGEATAARGLVLVSVKDAAKAGAWATKVLAEQGATTSTETYGGVTITLVTPPQGSKAPDGMKAAWATFGPVMALGDATSLRAAIDTKGSTGLPTTARFKTAEASVPGDRLGFAYVDAEALLKGVQAAAGAASPLPSLPAFVGDLGVAWTAFSVRAEGNAFVVDAATPHNAKLGSTKVAASKLPALLPPSTVALVEGHDVGEALERVKVLLAGEPSLADGLKQVDDALALLGGYGAIVDWMGEAGIAITVDGDRIGGGLVVTPVDPAAPARLFTQLRGFLSLAGASAGIKVSEEAYGGATIVVIDLGDLGALSGVTVGAVPVPANLAIAYAVTDDIVVLGSGTDFVKAVLDARTGGSLAESERFKTALKLVDASHGALGWLDLAAVRGFVELQVPADDKVTFDTEIKPYLDALDSVISVHTPGETLDRSKVIVRVSGS